MFHGTPYNNYFIYFNDGQNSGLVNHLVFQQADWPDTYQKIHTFLLLYSVFQVIVHTYFSSWETFVFGHNSHRFLVLKASLNNFRFFHLNIFWQILEWLSTI